MMRARALGGAAAAGGGARSAGQPDVAVGCLGGRVVSLSLDGLQRTQPGHLAPRFDAAGFALPVPIPPWLPGPRHLRLRRHGADRKREAAASGSRDGFWE
jgi:hypothetical protein